MKLDFRNRIPWNVSYKLWSVQKRMNHIADCYNAGNVLSIQEKMYNRQIARCQRKTTKACEWYYRHINTNFTVAELSTASPGEYEAPTQHGYGFCEEDIMQMQLSKLCQKKYRLGVRRTLAKWGRILIVNPTRVAAELLVSFFIGYCKFILMLGFAIFLRGSRD